MGQATENDGPLLADLNEQLIEKCSVRSPRAPQEQPRGSASYSFTYKIQTWLILQLSKKQYRD